MIELLIITAFITILGLVLIFMIAVVMVLKEMRAFTEKTLMYIKARDVAEAKALDIEPADEEDDEEEDKVSGEQYMRNLQENAYSSKSKPKP